jgi:ATP-dependent Clp protease ATP-binding subunit ClpA
VSLAARHLPSRHFPDKAIDLLDEAGAQAAKTDAAQVRLEDVMAALPRVKSGQSHAAAKQRGLAGNLSETLIGQQAAVELISETIEAAQLAISERNAPLAAMLLVGPPASGKSSAARAIAEAIFDGALTVLDMTEYTEPSTVSSLLGAPPGYVGFEQRARLIEPIRHKPQQVVLIKHLDAAAPQVRAVFADILSAGSLRDYHERLASFRETVLIFTVTTEAKPGGSLGFRTANLAAPTAEVNDSERGGLRSLLGGNIVDVVDEIIRFAPLDAAALRAAADRRLSALIEGLRHRGVEVALDPELTEHLVYVVGKAGGLRDLERYVSRLIERPIAIALVGAPGASAIRVSLREGKGFARVDQGTAVPVLVPARRQAPKARK